MKRTNPTALAGAALVILGALGLLQNLGVLGALAGMLWATAFGVAGLLFLGAFLRGGEMWWAAIPGCALLGLAAVVGLDTLAPWASDGWVGGVFLASLGLGFCLVYAARRAFWWALIPGGVMLSVAAVAALSDVLSGSAVGAVLFLGMAATFAALTQLPETEGRLRWAWVPAGVMGAMGLVVLLSAGPMVSLVVPVALIAGGLAILYRSGRLVRQGGGGR